VNLRVLLSLLLAVTTTATCGTASAVDEIFVTNSNSNAVTVYARRANGNVAPMRTLTGNLTGLSSPSGIAVDEVNDEIYVANKTAPYSVTVYPRSANGNIAPLRTITGNLTKLDDPRGVSVDTLHGEIAVANRAGFSITVFPRLANGNIAPARSLETPIGLSHPWGVVIDVEHDEIAVANNGNFISVFARTATGAAAPLRTFSGSNTGFNNGPVGIALGTAFDEYLVSTPFYDDFDPAVLMFARLPGGNVSPQAVIGGSPATTALSNPNGIAVDNATNLIYVANSSGDSIAVHQRLLTGVAPPLRVVSGSSTLLNNPQFVALGFGLFSDGFEDFQ
jgi:DNA-binding beta-propeller fold protein YncE